jgi:uncharacterized cysteine cluster protein YcgN (CxxCxxCC family)
MSDEEWESLCDGCGRCCLVKLEDPETEDVLPTAAACRMLDLETVRCTRYGDRSRVVAACVSLTPENVAALPGLPPTCAYRLLAEGRDLPDWHPLVSGDPTSVVEAGISMRGRAVRETDVHPDDLLEMRIRW